MSEFLDKLKQTELDRVALAEAESRIASEARALEAEIAGHTSFLPSQYNAYRYRADRLLRSVNGRFDMHHVKDAIR